MRFKRCYTPVSDFYDRTAVKALGPLELMSMVDFFRVTRGGVTKLGTKKRVTPSVSQIDYSVKDTVMGKVLERLDRENVMSFYETAKVQRFVVQRIQDQLLTPRFKKYLKAARANSTTSAQVEESLVESMVQRATHYLSSRDQGYFENIMMRKGLAL